MNVTTLKKRYDLVIIFLALISVNLVLLDIISLVNLNTSPFKEVDTLILLIFTMDYFVRLYLSENKKSFFKTNIFDLVAIIPFHSAFAIFRITRFVRLTRSSRLSRFSRTSRLFGLTRILGVIGKATKHVKAFLKTNGFIYMMYIGAVILLTGATFYSIAENVDFIDSLWWAFVTSTTVGYGDISPSTHVGRLTAIVLMLTGIGLFGALTSTMTSFFMNDPDKEIESQRNEIKELNTKITQLLEKMEKLEINN
ncbi:voltage-gated potassium channel [Alkalibacterium subtropicum]|uniref:Voltage-gated potassium channel n=1 Tax=Alkalibacterium subtropicum TaxID=753702 RepID=A0A1I1KEY7_9LACT|nr:potassium channel family protein [Alkalibacterium subtropicum]SFC59377.1 voltage-gated potassium channel [Alkalibacterium subtropicum]